VRATAIKADIGRRIAELRSTRGLTQEQLAERLRIDARTVQRIEAGQNQTLDLLIGFAKVLGVSVAALFDAPRSRAARRPGRPAAQREIPAAAEEAKRGRGARRG
jgi:transcriptional regulator with XRE-family HTH domain